MTELLLQPVDESDRAQTLDTRQSFLVQAPAGSGKTELQLMLEASAKALDDAGLRPHDIDGIVGPPLGASADCARSATASRGAAARLLERLPLRARRALPSPPPPR